MDLNSFWVLIGTHVGVFIAGVILSTKIKDKLKGTPTALRTAVKDVETHLRGAVNNTLAEAVSNIKAATGQTPAPVKAPAPVAAPAPAPVPAPAPAPAAPVAPAAPAA